MKVKTMLFVLAVGLLLAAPILWAADDNTMSTQGQPTYGSSGSTPTGVDLEWQNKVAAMTDEEEQHYLLSPRMDSGVAFDGGYMNVERRSLERDYSSFTNEELKEIKGMVGHLTSEQQSAFWSEWQRRGL